MYIKFCKFRRATLAMLMMALFLLPLSAQSASSDADDVMERYQQEQKERELKRAEDDRLEALDKELVENDLAAYSFPLEQSLCDDFEINWKQIATVQMYVDISINHAKSLGNCLHDEVAANVEALAKDLEKANIGTTQWSWNGTGMSDSIDMIAPFAKFSANHDRCSFRCFDLFRGLLERAARVAAKKKDLFLQQWDQYTESNIKAALRAQDPAAYKQNNYDDKFARVRDALDMYAYKRNAVDK